MLSLISHYISSSSSFLFLSFVGLNDTFLGISMTTWHIVNKNVFVTLDMTRHIYKTILDDDEEDINIFCKVEDRE